MFRQKQPLLTEELCPPVVRGAASLAEALSNGAAMEDMLASLSGPFADAQAILAAAYDTSVLAFLSNRPAIGLALQRDVLVSSRLFRHATGPQVSLSPKLRVLAFAAPGDLQMNMPIEFMTYHLDVRLDVLFVAPPQELPDVLPEHDVAICLISDSDVDALAWLATQLARWPRPVLNHPALVAGGGVEKLTRDGIARLFADSPDILAPATVARSKLEIAAHLDRIGVISELVPGADWPLLLRPFGSHAGRLLERLEGPGELAVYITSLSDEHFHLAQFVDYRSRDGLFRKLRVALIGGVPFLCHMAVSEHWMLHYANAGMAESAAKRDDEARAMAEFETGFGHRHRAAFAELHRKLSLDYVVIDCAEAPDGRLLLFEVEMAAIVHMLDPAEPFGYKQPQMRRIFDAFDRLLERNGRLIAA